VTLEAYFTSLEIWFKIPFSIAQLATIISNMSCIKNLTMYHPDLTFNAIQILCGLGNNATLTQNSSSPLSLVENHSSTAKSRQAVMDRASGI
jgi:hypothetical protein